jgi:DNA-binding PadR family transcriptional regulator
MAQYSRRNPLALAVLTCLYEHPMHPYEISQTLKQRAKEQSIKLNFGSLYNVVESLEKHGLVRERETIQEGRRPPRTIYEITDDGTREMSDWLSELVAIPVKEYLQFEAALSLLGGLPPDDAADLLTTRVENLSVRLALLRASLGAAADHGLPRLFALEDEYQLALLEAELDWVRRLVKDIRDGELGGLDEWRSWYEDGAGPPRFELGPGIPT